MNNINITINPQSITTTMNGEDPKKQGHNPFEGQMTMKPNEMMEMMTGQMKGDEMKEQKENDEMKGNPNSSQTVSRSKESPIHEMLHNCAPFVAKLYSLVNKPEYNSLIRWSEEHKCKAFIITDSVQFAQQILPYHFKHSNIASFVRQLNIYGFHKIEHKTALCFKHDHFIKDQPQLLEKIKRKKNKKATQTQTETQLTGGNYSMGGNANGLNSSFSTSLGQSQMAQQLGKTDSELYDMFSIRIGMTKLEKDLIEIKHEIQNNMTKWSVLKNKLEQMESLLPMIVPNFQNQMQQPMSSNSFNPLLMRRFPGTEETERRPNL